MPRYYSARLEMFRQLAIQDSHRFNISEDAEAFAVISMDGQMRAVTAPQDLQGQVAFATRA